MVAPFMMLSYNRIYLGLQTTMIAFSRGEDFRVTWGDRFVSIWVGAVMPDGRDGGFIMLVDNARRILGTCGILAAVCNCSGSGTSPLDGLSVGGTSNGGSPTGGATGTGSTGVGGSTGGTASAGGGAQTGGSVGNGGAMGTGGALGIGGTFSTGGAAGGAVATGGVNATGGVPSIGGSKSTGGTTSLGGAAATGGTKATGGVSSAGGSSRSTGGSTAPGGTASTGGNTSAAGAENSTGCGNATLPAACNNTTTGSCTINVGGTDRQYFVVLPDNYNANTPYPVVFLWHGLTGTAQQLIGGGFQAYYGVRTGFPNAIYVSAQGLPSTAGGTDYGWPNTNGQDINFTKAMIDWLESNYCVDKGRLFSTGMSYGGMMSNTIGCQMSDVFRAIAPMAGALFGRANTCLTNPIAAWYTHGDADTTVDISGDITARDMFIQHNGCDTTNTRTVAMSDGITTCTIYDVCTSGNYPVVWCPVPGGGHTVPRFAGAEIAKFFLQF